MLSMFAYQRWRGRVICIKILCLDSAISILISNFKSQQTVTDEAATLCERGQFERGHEEIASGFYIVGIGLGRLEKLSDLLTDQSPARGRCVTHTQAKSRAQCSGPDD